MSTTHNHASNRVASEVEAGHSEKHKPEEHGDESSGVIAESAPIDERTIFERKAALVNDEIDKFGFGKYQWCIWMLCGLGYFADLAWAQGVGLMATAVL